MSDVVIQAEALAKTYRVADKEPGFVGTLKHFVARKEKEIHAVKGASFEIRRGEMVGFLGANGAGKTTTLKMLTGLIHPSAGRVDVAGFVPFERKKAFLKEITLVMGNKQQLIWDLPALDSLRINAAVYEIPEAEADGRIKELSEMLEVGHRLQQPVRKLSLGERMKVELLAALLHRPSVLFLDEPTLGLDVNAQSAIRAFLESYNARFGATVLLTSHYMADITRLCSRVLLIDDGNLVYDGALAALLERHAPHREIRVESHHAIDRDKLPARAEVVDVDGHLATLRVDRERLAATITELLASLEVKDLSVKDPPVEEIIGALFHSPGERGTASMS